MHLHFLLKYYESNKKNGPKRIDMMHDCQLCKAYAEKIAKHNKFKNRSLSYSHRHMHSPTNRQTDRRTHIHTQVNIISHLSTKSPLCTSSSSSLGPNTYFQPHGPPLRRAKPHNGPDKPQWVYLTDMSKRTYLRPHLSDKLAQFSHNSRSYNDRN